MISIDTSLAVRKQELLTYFRERANESLEQTKHSYSPAEYKRQASSMNKANTKTRNNIISTLLQNASRKKWSNREILECILMITYTNYIIMFESRNDVWPYDYMAFSRRIGELWEPFCKLCFEYSARELTFFVPPLFSEVKQKLATEIEDYISGLGITQEQKEELKKYYNKVWGLLAPGEVKLELDLHFEQDGEKIVVDFKSGFGSNEKGNTNRLLLVATVYKNLEENYKCLLLVRTEEYGNNNYFRILRNSGVWEAFCGNEAYAKIDDHSGFNIKRWIEENVDWDSDFRSDTMHYFRDNDLDQYLKW